MKRRRLYHACSYTIVCVYALVAAGSFGKAQALNKTIWDGVYTKEQAERGRATYSEACSHCHGRGLVGGEVNGELAPTLKGVYFVLRWSGSLSELFGTIENSMPKDDPGAVSSQDTADIIAYLLQSNDAQPGESEIPPSREKARDIQVTKKPN
jgi:quinoprotein glucose dehydrogenase